MNKLGKIIRSCFMYIIDPFDYALCGGIVGDDKKQSETECENTEIISNNEIKEES